jgi:hypothetical protein
VSTTKQTSADKAPKAGEWFVLPELADGRCYGILKMGLHSYVVYGGTRDTIMYAGTIEASYRSFRKALAYARELQAFVFDQISDECRNYCMRAEPQDKCCEHDCGEDTCVCAL